METKKKRGRPKKIVSEFAGDKVSGRADLRNPEVFVLPPEILRQLGIHLNKQHETSNQDAGSHRHHVGQGQLSSVQPLPNSQPCLQNTKRQKLSVDLSNAIEYKIPKRIDAKVQSIIEPKKSVSPIDRPSTSIMETANLMKASLFLSPTFSQANCNKSSVIQNSLEMKNISDSLNDSETTTSVIDDLPGNVIISNLSIGGLNEVLNSAVDLVSEETRFKDSSISIDNVRNCSMECRDVLVDSVNKENIINTEETVNNENHCEIIEENRIFSENIEFLKEIQEMSDENILLEIYDISKTNLSDANVADCNILESTYEVDNSQICVSATSNSNNEFNQDVIKYITDTNLLEASRDTNESKYDTEGSRDSNTTDGREDYTFTNVPYVTSTPMINVSDIDMGIENGIMEDSNNFVDACMSNDSSTITINTQADVPNVTVISNLDYFDINSDNRNNDSSTITSETTLSVVESFSHVEDINTNQDVNSNQSKNLSVKDNLKSIQTPPRIIGSIVNAEAKEQLDHRNKKEVNIINETVIQSAVHSEILSKFVNKVLTSNTCKSPVPLDHNIQLAQDHHRTSNQLHKFHSSRKENAVVCDFHEGEKNFIAEKPLNIKSNQPSDEINFGTQHFTSDNEIVITKGHENVKKFDNHGDFLVKYKSEERIFDSPKKYISIKDNIKSSLVESGIFLENRSNYNLDNLKSCPKANKICVVSPLNIFAKKEHVKNSYNSKDTFGKISPTYDKAKIYNSKTSELKIIPERSASSPKLSNSVIKMLLDPQSNHETLTKDMEITTVIPTYIHSSSIITNASNIVQPVSNHNCEDVGKIVVSNDQRTCLSNRVSSAKFEVVSHGKKIRDSKVLNVVNETFTDNSENDLIPVEEKCSTSRLMPENVTDVNNKYSKRERNTKEMIVSDLSSNKTDAQVALIAKYIKAAVQSCKRTAKYHKNSNIKSSIKNENKILLKNCKSSPSRKILNTHGVEKPGGNLQVDVKESNTKVENNCVQLKESDVKVHLFEDTLNEKNFDRGAFQSPEEVENIIDSELNSSSNSISSHDTKEIIDMSNFGYVSYNTLDNFITNENDCLVVEEIVNERRKMAVSRYKDISEPRMESSLMKCGSEKDDITKISSEDDTEKINNSQESNMLNQSIDVFNTVNCEVLKENSLDSQVVKENTAHKNVSHNFLNVHIENDLSGLGAPTSHISTEDLELCSGRHVNSKKTLPNSYNPNGAICELIRINNCNSEDDLNSNIYAEKILDENISSKKLNKELDEVINISKSNSISKVSYFENVEREGYSSDCQIDPCNLDPKIKAPEIDLALTESSSVVKSAISNINIDETFDRTAKDKVIRGPVKDYDESTNNESHTSSLTKTIVQLSSSYEEIVDRDFNIINCGSNLGFTTNPVDENADLDGAILYPKTADPETIFGFEEGDRNNEETEISKCNSVNELDNHGEISNDAHSDMDIDNIESEMNINNAAPVLKKKLPLSMFCEESSEYPKSSEEVSDTEIKNQDNENISKTDITIETIDDVSVNANICLIESPRVTQSISTDLSGYVNEGKKLQSTIISEKDKNEMESNNTTLYDADNKKIESSFMSKTLCQNKDKHEQINEKFKPFKKREINTQISTPLESFSIVQSKISNISQSTNAEALLPVTSDEDMGRSFVWAEIEDVPNEARNLLAIQGSKLETTGSGLNLVNDTTSKIIDNHSKGQNPEAFETPSNIIKKKRGRPKKEVPKLTTPIMIDNSNQTSEITHNTSMDIPCTQVNSYETINVEKIENNLSPVPKKRGRPKKNVEIHSSSIENKDLNSTFKSAICSSTTENLNTELDDGQITKHKDHLLLEAKESFQIVLLNESSRRKRSRSRESVCEVVQGKRKRGRPKKNLQQSTSFETKTSPLTGNDTFSSTEGISRNANILESSILRKKANHVADFDLEKSKASMPAYESTEAAIVTKRDREKIIYSEDKFDDFAGNKEQYSQLHKKNVDHLGNAVSELDESIKQAAGNSSSQKHAIKCGLCEAEVASNQWMKHSAVEHNYLAHRSGEEPINIEDEKVVTRLLRHIHKELVKDFECKICGSVRSSASGFYNHIVSCLKGEMSSPKTSKKIVYEEPEVPTTSIVKCAVCSEEMVKKKWSEHLLNVHNNLAWFEGAKPIDLQNEKLVLAILIRVAKKNHSITCHKCGIKRASALGFIAHMEVCQKSEEEIDKMKITCEVCQKVVMPGNMRAHMKKHETSILLSEKSLEGISEEDLQAGGKDGDSGGKRKRAAAKAAESSFAKLDIETPEENIDWKIYWKEPFNGCAHKISIHRWHSNVKNNKPNRCYHIGCKYKDATVEGIRKHYEKECPFINEDYQCRRCKFHTKTLEEMKNHAVDTHVKTCVSSDSDSQMHILESDDDQFDDMPVKSVRDELSDKVANKTSKMRVIKPMPSKLIPDWTKQLYGRHLSRDSMFTELTCQPLTHVSICEVLKYLPVTRESCHISNLDYVVNLNKRKQTFTDWRKYQLFESTVFNGAISMFCGGPIQRMAWAPTRDVTAQDAEDQLLAVSLHKDFSEEGYSTLISYSHSNMLQFWLFSRLSNKSTCDQSARLVLGLCHDYGVIWDMAWCPSGGHMDSTEGTLTRIGLLSIACSNGLAYVFAIQDPTKLGESETQFCKTKPVMELRLDISCNERLNYQATSITWSMERGHNIIAVGYSHGYIALFDLTIDSPLLRTFESGVMIIGPYYSNPEMLSPVTGLTIYPCKQEETSAEEGIILGAGSTAGTNIWSRYGTSNQICLAHKKVNVTATFCIPHWPNLVCSLDNSSAKTGGVELALRSLSWEQQRHDDAASQRVLCSAAACLSVHTCWWSGLTMQSTGSGKLLVLPALHPSYYASRPRTQILTEYDLVKLEDRQPASEVSLDTYEAATKDHGVVIREYIFNSNMPGKLAPHVNKAPQFSCESYNFTNLTSISINPSASACSYVARGLQCGIVHVAPIRTLS